MNTNLTLTCFVEINASKPNNNHVDFLSFFFGQACKVAVLKSRISLDYKNVIKKLAAFSNAMVALKGPDNFELIYYALCRFA